MSERSKKSKNQYTEEFRADAVRLVVDEELPVAQVARDLGMPPNTLHSWVREARASGAGSTGGRNRSKDEQDEAWCTREPSQRARANAALLEHIRRIFEASNGRYGAGRIQRALKLDGHQAGKHRVARLMRENGLFARRRRAFRATTDSKHAYPVADNVLDREFEADTPVQAMALAQRRPDKGFIHHTDRGSQYAAHAYQDELRRAGAIVSMSRKGNCWDNAPSESFFSTIKTELIHERRFTTRDEAKGAILRYLMWYNAHRLHSSLDYLSPMHFERLQLTDRKAA